MIPISLQPRADGVTIKDTFAEYTLVDNVFTTPLLLASRAGQRMHRLDERAFHWSPISTDAWSPSGASTSERPQE